MQASFDVLWRGMGEWTFITKHGAVLALVAEHGQITAREIARNLDITERSVHRIISDLEESGYLERRRQGRVNWYQVRYDKPLGPHEWAQVPVGELLDVLTKHDATN